MRPTFKLPSVFGFLIGCSLFVGTPAHAQNLLDLIFGGGGQRRQQPRYEPRPRYDQNQDPWGGQRQQDPWGGQRQDPWGGQADDGYGHGDPLRGLGTWVLKQPFWSDSDELAYSDFVRAIGRSGCTTVDSCMRSEANPYRDTDPTSQEYRFWSDCADWPYFLRSYFAWKNGLPMAISQGMVQLPLTPEQQQSIADGKEVAQTDVRYSWNGNKPSRRLRLPMDSQYTNFFDVHKTIQNSVHTATLRVDPRTNFGDFYTPAIRQGAIRPGSVIYDPSGHVGVVYDITPDGQVMVFDALIDTKSISPRRAYSADFYKRSKPAHGGWILNFRPVVIEGAQYDNFSNSYIGGKLRLLTNAEIHDYSDEMFGNTTTADGKSAYNIEGKITNSFQEFLRRRMFMGRYTLDVIGEFKVRMKTICDDFGSRVSLVQDGTTKGVAAKPHAETLPNTIYGGSGEWDTFSTPGGDVRRRNSVNNALATAKELKAQVDRRNPEYTYRGKDLKADFIKAASETLKSCSITYKNTRGQAVKLTLEQLLKRMPMMSFSPWHCVELRWGATAQQELATCPDLRDQTKMRWYNAQQTLRNQMARDTNIFTGYTLEQLEQKAADLGPAQSENFDLLTRLQNEL
ncbi:MAG: hypothetical protein KF767_11295 [Bdellovibrionaceae bacterium]|nr:hypothetical protein [Pseudobdellovibrionaceae bacterium]